MTNALDILKTVYGYSEFRLHQADIIQALIDGQDVMTLMPTGGGKSLCYQIPALVRDGTGIIISPLIALMQDQVDALKQLGVRAAFLNSTLDFASVQQVQQDLLAGKLDLLYVAPERLLTQSMQNLMDNMQIALFAIDEAHCVSQWGHDFRKDYQQLSMLHERYPDVPRIALTATADNRTRNEIIQQLDLSQATVYVNSFDRPNIHYTISDGQNPRDQLWQFLQSEHAQDAGIVYCLSRKKVESISEWLQKKGRNALPYHAGLSDKLRQHHQARFLREEGVIIVATIAFGMGIDKPDVRFVAHLNLPKSIEAYYQETGRAGRDGAPANAWMGFGLQDVITLRAMMQDTDASEEYKRISHNKLEAMLGLCELTSCRRQMLMAYFGETMEQPCGHCDNCNSPPETWDGTVAAQKALSCIYRSGQRFGVNYIIDVLTGNMKDERIVRNQHDKLSTFGIGADLGVAEWRSVFRQLVAQGYLHADMESHGALKLTDKCRPLLRGETSLQFRKLAIAVKTKKDKVVKATSLRSYDETLFQALRTLRLSLSEKQGVPAYVIFHDQTLMDMAHTRPVTLEELRFIGGVGEQKLKLYGQIFLDEINAHKVPDILRNKLTDTVNETLFLHTQDKDAEDIAKERNLTVSTIYGHFAQASAAGLVDVSDILPIDDAEYNEIVNTIEMLDVQDEGSLKSVYESLDESYDYGVLKCVFASLNIGTQARI